MGRLLHWKGFHLAIRAFARLAEKDADAELWIVNDGPFRGELEKTAAQVGVGSRVKFFGRLATYEEVLEKLARSHVLIHPALHEGFGNVCMEALAAGRPVVCLDIGGPASQVTPETGFAAPVTTVTEAVESMASFLDRVASDRALLAKMSAQARLHARERFTMQRLGAVMNSFYHEAAARTPNG
jgi:glycosyltransferase involved in cell wall biosynthesis